MTWLYKTLAAVLSILGLGAAAILFRRHSLKQAARLRVYEKTLERKDTLHKIEQLRDEEEDYSIAEEALLSRVEQLEKEVVAEHRSVDRMSLEEIRDEFKNLGY